MISHGQHSITTSLAFAFGLLLGHQLDWIGIVLLAMFIGLLGFTVLAGFGAAELFRGDQA